MNNYIYIYIIIYIYYLISIDISSYFSEYKSSYIYIFACLLLQKCFFFYVLRFIMFFTFINLSVVYHGLPIWG